MKTLKPWLFSVAVGIAVVLAGCSAVTTKSADVSNSIRTSLDQAGFKEVTVSQNREKGVVTLGGHVVADNDKAQAESIAKSYAGAQVVANEIAVWPAGAEADAKSINSDLDKGIESNLHAALVRAQLQDNVKYSVKNHVVRLTGEVESQMQREQAAKVAGAVLNVDQVVNELQVKTQKASSLN